MIPFFCRKKTQFEVPALSFCVKFLHIIVFLNHKLNMKMVHVKTLFKGSINSVIYCFDIGHVHYFETYTHTVTNIQNNQRKVFTTNLQRFVQEILPVNLPRRWTYTLLLVKVFLSVCTERCYIVPKSSNRLNEESHQVKQFANGVILAVFIQSLHQNV